MGFVASPPVPVIKCAVDNSASMALYPQQIMRPERLETADINFIAILSQSP